MKGTVEVKMRLERPRKLLERTAAKLVRMAIKKTQKNISQQKTLQEVLATSGHHSTVLPYLE